MFSPAVLWQAPEINPINRKARSIPLLNVFNVYGRVFNFSWFGFFVAFWSWYAFPPLLTITIKKDINLTTVDVLNSNIVALTATLLVRLVAGPCCDRFGPRLTFAGCLLLGSIPTALAGAVYNAQGLLALRFFVGILGGSFVPCQVWSTGFFDKNVVGTANALTGGWGNAGGGITYFLMPVIFDSLVHQQGLTPHVAWRVAFIVPFIVIVAVAIGMLLTCPDTPTGKWSDRHLHAQENLAAHGVREQVVPIPGSFQDEKHQSNPADSSSGQGTPREGSTHSPSKLDLEKRGGSLPNEAKLGETAMIEIARGEVIQAPTMKDSLAVLLSPQTLVQGATYFCTFGAELAINSSLGSYYLLNFPALGQTGTGRWAAMFGLLNVATRPLGGMVSDLLYRYTGSLWVKKLWNHFVLVIAGGFLVAIGLLDPRDQGTMFGLVAAMAVFLEAGNGANFSLIPHVHPHANGIISGLTGAAGNLGGIVFAIIFRYNGTHYARTIWIIGIMCVAISLATVWIKPIPKGQIGGR